MLILTRRYGQTIFIGSDVKVTVLAIHGNQVRIGITAPKEVPVNREEVAERIATEQMAGAALPPPAASPPKFVNGARVR